MLVLLFFVQLMSEANPLQFSQMFQLMGSAPGQYHLNSDSLRLMNE
jgi:hypothetical protein